jgi:LuxR family maltose regulon positive regulatory protein
VTAPLLKTKLYIPPLRPGMVSRPRLIAKLEDGLRPGNKLILLSAPAGFGKTTLLSEWATRCEPRMPVGWISLDAGDNDPVRFWSYLISALETIHKGVGVDVQIALRSRQPPPIEELLTGLINQVVGISIPLALVLDDYHVVDAQPIHSALGFLLDHLPSQMHLIIATRADPPLHLSRLRARSQMVELRTDDLRLTVDEATAFLNDAMDLQLSAEDVAALEARTEGWIAGLQMAALSLQGQSREQAHSFVRAFTGSHRYVLDYLTDEVLLRQPADRQRFLLQTSILDRLSASLCDAVCEQAGGSAELTAGGQEMLAQLDAANLFVVPLDDSRRWYRYHHLFAELLRRRLGQTQGDLVPELHRRASAWYERHRLIAKAVQHALASGDMERAGRLVGGNTLSMMEYGELRAIERWIDALPEEMMRAQPWLSIAHAWLLAFTGQLDAAETALASAADGLVGPSQAGGPSPESRWLGGHIACIRAYVVGLEGDPLQAAELAREALSLLPSEDLLTRGWVTMALGIYLYRAGDLGGADQALAKAVAISRATGDSHVAVLALCNLAVAHRDRGKLARAANTFRDALQLAREYADRAGQQLPVSAYAHTYLAAVLCEWNDPQAALDHVYQGIELCERWGEPQLLVGSYMQLAGILVSVGDTDGALDAAHKAKAAARMLSPGYAARVDPVEALAQLRRGNVEAAIQWADTPDVGLSGRDGPYEYWARCGIRARVRMAQGRTDEALEELAGVLQAAEAAESQLHVIASLRLQALALQARGELDRALAALERALALAEPEGYVRRFIGEGAPMGDLLREAAARGIAAGYVEKLLSALDQEAKAHANGTQQRDDSPMVLDRPSPVLVEPLSARELQVLRLLAAGLSNLEIAEELYLSVNTIKTHTRNIYGKLGVRSRLQAANRAEELQLL